MAFLGSKSYFFSFNGPGGPYLQMFIHFFAYYCFTSFSLYKKYIVEKYWTIYIWVLGCQKLFSFTYHVKLATFGTVAQKPHIQFSFFFFWFLAKNKLNYASICKNGALLQFFVKIRLSAKKIKILHNFFLFNSQKQQF